MGFEPELEPELEPDPEPDPDPDPGAVHRPEEVTSPQGDEDVAAPFQVWACSV